MTPFNIVPWLIIVLSGLLALVLIYPEQTSLWWVVLFAIVSFFIPIADDLIRRICREDRENGTIAASAVIDANWRRIEANHGVSGRKRTVELAMKELRQHLTRAERAELDFLCATEPHKKAAE